MTNVKTRTVEKETAALGLLDDLAHFHIRLADVFAFQLEGIFLDEIIFREKPVGPHEAKQGSRERRLAWWTEAIESRAHSE